MKLSSVVRWCAPAKPHTGVRLGKDGTKTNASRRKTGSGRRTSWREHVKTTTIRFSFFHALLRSDFHAALPPAQRACLVDLRALPPMFGLLIYSFWQPQKDGLQQACRDRLTNTRLAAPSDERVARGDHPLLQHITSARVVQRYPLADRLPLSGYYALVVLNTPPAAGRPERARDVRRFQPPAGNQQRERRFLPAGRVQPGV